MRVLSVLLLTAFSAAAQQFSIAQLAHQPLTNESVLTLAKAGFDELFILQLIRNSRTNFDTSVHGLVGLKQAGLSEDLIRLMAMPVPSAPAAPAAAAAPLRTPSRKHGFFWKHWPSGQSSQLLPAPAVAPATTKL